MDDRFFRVIKHWLNAGDADPFYDPESDYVMVPRKGFEFNSHTEEYIAVTPIPDSDDGGVETTCKQVYIATVETGLVLFYTVSFIYQNRYFVKLHHVIVVCILTALSNYYGMTGSRSSSDIRAEAHAHVHHKPGQNFHSEIQVSTVGVAEGRDRGETKAALDQVMVEASEEAKAASRKNELIVSDKTCYLRH